MATYYYDAQATGANDGSSLTDAFQTYAAFVAALNVDGDIGYHVAESQENLSTATTYTFQANVSIYCVDRATGLTITDPYDVFGYIGSSTASRTVTLNTASGKRVYLSHYLHRAGSTTTAPLNIGSVHSVSMEFRVGLLTVLFNTSSGTKLYIGPNNGGGRVYVEVDQIRCSFAANHNRIIIRGGSLKVNDGVIDYSSAVFPTDIFRMEDNSGGNLTMSGDVSSLESDYLIGDCQVSPSLFYLSNVKLHANTSILSAQTDTTMATAKVIGFDIQIGTTNIPFYYGNALGSVMSDAGKYANDNLSGNRSYLVTTTASVTPDMPFIAPWIEQYHDDTSSISPYFAIARDSSATAFDNDEVWAEFDAKVTSGSVIKTKYSDGIALLGTPAAQTTDTDTTWTGLSGTNWKGKIGEQSLTPVEPGTISGRIVVGLPNTSFNWDTRIRF